MNPSFLPLDGGRALRHAQGMIRVIQLVLLVAVMVPFTAVVKSVVAGLSSYHLDMAVSALVGFCLCYALWRWDERIRQRGTGN